MGKTERYLRRFVNFVRLGRVGISFATKCKRCPRASLLLRSDGGACSRAYNFFSGRGKPSRGFPNRAIVRQFVMLPANLQGLSSANLDLQTSHNNGL